MGKVNVRRGLTRLYLVLWAIWIPVSIWYIQKSYVDEVSQWTKFALEEESAGAHAVAESSRALAEEYRKEWRASWLSLLGIYGVGLPALLYGLLYGSIMTLRGMLRWVVRGFKHDVPDRPTHSP